MPMEVLVMSGKGTVEYTGSLGNVMQESAKIAVSYARSVAKQYGIPEDFHTKCDLHIHAPEGAVPKDGPSAGVTMATAIEYIGITTKVSSLLHAVYAAIASAPIPFSAL